MFEEIAENFLKNYQILITANGAQHLVPLVICQIFFGLIVVFLVYFQWFIFPIKIFN